MLGERDIAKLPWRELEVDVVAECTGVFTKRDAAARHLEAGARKVLVSAPAEGADITVCYKVNHEQLRPEHEVVSNASCTTNCLAPVAKVLHDAVGIVRGHMTTIHSFTNDQNLWTCSTRTCTGRGRRPCRSSRPRPARPARSAWCCPSSRAGWTAWRSACRPRTCRWSTSPSCPSARPRRRRSTAIVAAADGPMQGVLGYHREPLVSVDFNHDSHSSTVDLGATKVLEGQLVRVASWYDNEWGFSCRMGDVAALLGTL